MSKTQQGSRDSEEQKAVLARGGCSGAQVGGGAGRGRCSPGPDPPRPPLPPAEKVSSLGKDWHKFCLKCERCNKTLTPGGHAEVSPLPWGCGEQGGGSGAPPPSGRACGCGDPALTRCPPA